MLGVPYIPLSLRSIIQGEDSFPEHPEPSPCIDCRQRSWRATPPFSRCWQILSRCSKALRWK